MKAYDALMAYQRDTEALAQIAGRLEWDQETMMPRGAAPQRGEECAALEGVLHARRTDPRLADWLDAAEPADEVAAAQLRQIARDHARATKIPARLATELARITSLGQGIWAEARRAEDVTQFLPTLTEIVRLRREEAACLAAGGDPYDALLDGYEPGATGASLAAMFDGLRPRLVRLREAILGANRQPAPLAGRFPAEAQLRLAREVATAFGYDWSRGRLDLAVHPFSNGSGMDVRITTRVVETEPFNCIYSTIHETGHATYELAVDPAYLLTPLGQGCSMGVHESQSRIYENQLGRSKAFARWLHPKLTEHFGPLSAKVADALHGAINRVQPGFIRTEADEVHYNLHIMLRFDLERQLVAGKLEAADMEEAWNARFAADFGAKVDKPSNGVLQDVHWSLGLFGYFPTYALGNVYAGCLMQALRADLPDLDASLAKGDTRPATAWLQQRLQRHGRLRAPRDTIAHACGFAPSEGPLLDYLEAKFGEIYGL